MGGSTIPGEYILPKVVGGFREKYPFVSVSLTIGDTKEIEKQVLEGNLELGVIGSKSSQKNLISHELWRDELVLAVPVEHRWARKKEISIDELTEEPFIFREPGSGTFKILEAYLQAADTKGSGCLRQVARIGSSTAVKEGIKAGLGVSILSSRAIDTELKTGILKALRVKRLQMVRSFYLIRDKRRLASPPCQAMLNFLLATAKE